MATHRETIIERDDETVVVDRNPLGAIAAIIAAIVVILLALWFFGVFSGGNPVTVNPAPVTIDPPSVTVTP